MAKQLQSTLTCPQCGYQATETMPEDACQFFYDCRGCGVRLRPKPGDCCVFCSYGDVPCPPCQSATADSLDLAATALDGVCSFCGKSGHQVEILIATKNGVHICDACVALCGEIITERRRSLSPV